MSNERSSHIYTHQVAPENCVRAGARGTPQFWIIAGENGVGKTTATERIAAGLQEPVQRINADDLVKYVDGYHDLALQDPAFAQDEASDFTSEWCENLLQEAAEKRVHILSECSSHEPMTEDVEYAKRLGYETGLYLIAEPKVVTWTAVVDRTDRALKSGHIGTCAMVSEGGHRQRYAAWPRAAFDAEQNLHFDHIIVARRDGTVMYHNRREERNGDGRWVNQPQALEVLLLERHRGLDRVQVDQLNKILTRCRNSLELRTNRFMQSPSLRRYTTEIFNETNSIRNQFDPFSSKTRCDNLGAAEWRDYLTKDLNLIKTSSVSVGHSDEFNLHIDRYAQALIELSRQQAPVSTSIRRLGQFRDVQGRLGDTLKIPVAPAPTGKRSFAQTLASLGEHHDPTNDPIREEKRPRLNDRVRSGRV